MKERLDCAIFNGAEQDHRVRQWLGTHANGRLHLHFLNGKNVGLPPNSVRLLAASAQQLCSYDACVLLVRQANLVWARTALASASGVLTIPIVVVAHELTAPALNDLYEAGVCDFVRDPVCIEELRVRVNRALKAHQYNGSARSTPSQVAESSRRYGQLPSATTLLSMDSFCENILDRSGMEIEAFAVASASRCATNKESFRMAKSKLIERFERAYITAALGRHAGNIAMAARSAQKHRRAFWELMRKHEIDPQPFRASYCPKAPQDG